MLLPHAGEGKPSPGADPAAAPGAVSAATGGEIRSEQQSAFIYPPFSSLPSLLLALGSGRSHCLTGRPGAAFGKQQAEGMNPPKISASLFPRRLMPPESDGCLEGSTGTRCDMRQTRAICPRSKSAAPRRSRHEAGALARPPRPFAHRPLPPGHQQPPCPCRVPTPPKWTGLSGLGLGFIQRGWFISFPFASLLSAAQQGTLQFLRSASSRGRQKQAELLFWFYFNRVIA